MPLPIRSTSGTSIVTTVAACLAIATSCACTAQLSVHKNFNDPATLVDQMMHLIPHSLNLTVKQRQEMRRIYLDLSTKEQQIALQPGPSIRKRGQVRAIALRSEHQIRALLSPKQYRALQQWQRTTHGPVRHF